jgi:hypothetical protein
MDPAILAPLNEKALTFKVWKGCPREFGATSVADTRTMKDPVADSRSQPLNLKAFTGTKAILAFWFGPAPERWVVVDFASGTSQTVKSPWMSGGANGYQVDSPIANAHARTVTQCR